MAVSTHLFELVNSLSSSEKRYFRLYCGLQGGEKNYLRLFDFVEQLTEYDEEKVKKKFEGETFVKSLHVTKNYLYNLVMKSLRSFHSQSGADQKIADYLTDATLLERRGLYEQATDALIKAKKLAAEYYRYYFMMPILSKEASLLISMEEKNLGENLEKIEAQFMKIAKELTNENNTLMLYYKVSLWERSQKASEDDISQLKNHWQDLHQEMSQSKFDSFYSNYLFDHINSIFYKHLHLFDKQLLYAKRVVELWEKNPQILEEDPNVYKIHLANYLNACFRVKKWEEFPPIIERLKSIPSSNFNQEAESFQNYAFYELLYYLNTRDLKNAPASIEQIAEGIKKYNSKINKARELAFYYNISVLYLLLRKFDNALLWLNKILNHPKTDHRKDIQRFANILQIFYHYELGNYDFLENLTDSVKRRLNRSKPLDEFENLLLTTINDLLFAESSSKKQTIFHSLYQSLKNESKFHQLGREEIMAWLEMK